ncbi:MAG: phenylacetate--CoA ligase, partial [Hydrogenoanaerobacterium sp.]
RGVNVFPSQIESVLLDLKMSPHYQIIVDRVGTTDTLDVMVEMTDNMEFDAVRLVEKTEAKIKQAIDSTLGISAKVHLVSPKSIERSEGKSKRVIDNRKLH